MKKLNVRVTYEVEVEDCLSKEQIIRIFEKSFAKHGVKNGDEAFLTFEVLD